MDIINYGNDRTGTRTDVLEGLTNKSLKARTRLQLTKWHQKRNRLIKIITYSYYY